MRQLNECHGIISKNCNIKRLKWQIGVGFLVFIVRIALRDHELWEWSVAFGKIHSFTFEWWWWFAIDVITMDSCKRVQLFVFATRQTSISFYHRCGRTMCKSLEIECHSSVIHLFRWQKLQLFRYRHIQKVRRIFHWLRWFQWYAHMSRFRCQFKVCTIWILFKRTFFGQCSRKKAFFIFIYYFHFSFAFVIRIFFHSHFFSSFLFASFFIRIYQMRICTSLVEKRVSLQEKYELCLFLWLKWTFTLCECNVPTWNWIND